MAGFRDPLGSPSFCLYAVSSPSMMTSDIGIDETDSGNNWLFYKRKKRNREATAAGSLP